jgi:hypothetical protein
MAVCSLVGSNAAGTRSKDENNQQEQKNPEKN